MSKVKLLGIIVILTLVVGGTAPFLARNGPAVAHDEQFQLAPLNPDFLDSIQQPHKSSCGYVPPTLDLSHLREIPVQRERALLAQPPSSWDWRDQGKVTPVKDQETCGTCWVFGTTSVLESAVLLDESTEYNFSEQSVALCVDPSWVYLYDDPTDPCQAGGNSLLASEVFIKKGAVLETCNPYNPSGLQCDGTCTCDSCTPVKKVTGYMYVTDDQSQTDLIKAAVYRRPVTMAFYCDLNVFEYDPTYGTIYDYYPCDEDANHLVSIIGWDDSVPHPDPNHLGTGAWLVKNSWGAEWGNDGYFWLAYDSSSMCGIAYLEYGDYDASEKLYYWDEAGIMGAGGAGTSAWMASVFTSEQDGDLTHVDFWTTSNNADYEIYVYDDGDPSDGLENQLTSQSGSCAEFGYYSIPLTASVPVTNGQQFTVAVEMTTPDFNYPIPVEYQIADYCEPPIQSGVCYMKHQVGDSWEDADNFADIGVNVCLRAKVTIPEPPTATTNVDVRIEGENDTIWSGSVAVGESWITADNSGVEYHLENPTALGALDEASQVGGFLYQTTDEWGSLFVTSIDAEEGEGMAGWMYRIDYISPSVGAADFILNDSSPPAPPHQEVLWYYGEWDAIPLKIEVDNVTPAAGDIFTVTVSQYDGDGWSPTEGATVYADTSYTTDEDGEVNITISNNATIDVYAEKDGYIRSNRVTIIEVTPGDANDDDSVNALDITKVERIVAGLDSETPGADANQDGNVNALDITKVERIVAGLD